MSLSRDQTLKPNDMVKGKNMQTESMLAVAASSVAANSFEIDIRSHTR